MTGNGNWTRVSSDAITVYDSSGQEIGKLYKTYGIQVLEVGPELVKIFSPDLNRNGYICKDEIDY